MAIVASGTAIAQVITLLSAPIITRIYGPEAFGILGAFNALLVMTTPLAALSYPIAIVLPKNDRDALGLVLLSLKISLLTSLLVAFVFIVAKDAVLQMLNLAEVGDFIWLLPLAMVLSVLLATTTQWVVRKKLFSLKAKVAVAHAVLQNGLKISLGLIAPVFSMLITVATFGYAINAILFYFGIRRSKKGAVSNSDSPQNSQIVLAKDYNDFALYRTPQLIISAVGQGMPVLMLTALFGPAAAGFYALSRLVLGAPAQLIGQSVQTVFYPHFNETIRNGKSGLRLLIKSTASLMVVGILPFTIVIAIGPWLFSSVFGPDWQVAGEISQWLSVWMFFSLAARPAISAIPVLRLQGLFLFFEITFTLLRILSLYLAYITYGTLMSVIIWYALSNVLIYLTLILWVGHSSKLNTKNLNY
ncbi:lipopolysaccharide biosynthesis protein [Aliidiomarina indica]|uniref:lipopolysaccharide biosynthesis protein n=1 Tax=Aliidiomarina indica TaxID=2749147 RepID=UPI001890B312